ncbi:MAG TPA: porin [Beijerinckiaceae bacterium]|nr:porin [Beijerinckiaceae bacterium]
MKSTNRALALAAVSILALAAASSVAQAGAFGLREQSATLQGMSFAGAASGAGGVSSTYWNPATITMKPGWNSEYHVSVVVPEAKIDPGPGTSPFLASPPFSGNFLPSGDIGETGVIPSSYSSYQISDSVWFGIASTAPYGLVTKPEPVWAGQIYARTSKVFSLNVNPILGWKVTDWLSIAAGPAVQYFDVRLERATAPGAAASTLTLEGDDVGIGATAGVNLTLPSQTNIGVGFRSSIHHDLEGKVRVPGTTLIPIEASLNTPEMVTVGISQAFTPYFRVHAGFEWTNWSRLKTPTVTGPGGRTVTALVLNYDDGYFYSLGAEYDFSDRWTFRAGVAYEDSPINDANRTPVIPDNDRIWASVGATYKWSEKLSFDVSYTHIFVDDTKIDIREGREQLLRAGPVGLPLIADVNDANVNIISAAVKYRWDDPKVAVPAAVVRKY